MASRSVGHVPGWHGSPRQRTHSGLRDCSIHTPTDTLGPLNPEDSGSAESRINGPCPKRFEPLIRYGITIEFIAHGILPVSRFWRIKVGYRFDDHHRLLEPPGLFQCLPGLSARALLFVAVMENRRAVLLARSQNWPRHRRRVDVMPEDLQ